jgi:hypothetical protein
MGKSVRLYNRRDPGTDLRVCSSKCYFKLFLEKISQHTVMISYKIYTNYWRNPYSGRMDKKHEPIKGQNST